MAGFQSRSGDAVGRPWVVAHPDSRRASATAATNRPMPGTVPAGPDAIRYLGFTLISLVMYSADGLPAQRGGGDIAKASHEHPASLPLAPRNPLPLRRQ